MTSRLDNFEGSVDAYILYLEHNVQFLRRQGHKPQGRKRQKLASDGKHEPIQIKFYEPRRAGEKRVSTNRWTSQAEQLVQQTPPVAQWASKLRETGLHKTMEDNGALTYILSTTIANNPDVNNCGRSGSGDPIANVRRYAECMKEPSTKASVDPRLVNFQKLLVLSACAVLLDNGYEKEAVLGVAKMCTGETITTDYCNRLVQSSKFVNRLIDTLIWKGWGYRATELLLLWDYTPNWYYGLACYATDSTKYLTTALTKEDIMDPRQDLLENKTAIYIPSIVRAILGREFSYLPLSVALEKKLIDNKVKGCLYEFGLRGRTREKEYLEGATQHMRSSAKHE